MAKEIFESSLRGNGLKEICRDLNNRGVTNRGKRWHKAGIQYLLTNETYTGTAVWGRTSKGKLSADPVRVEGAWQALVSRELFDKVQQALRERAPASQRPARVGSKFLLSGLCAAESAAGPTPAREPRAASSPTTSAARCTGKAREPARPAT